jgi:magnesium chelatase subunit I
VRPADLFTGISAVTGKLELVYDGEREGIATVARALVGKALFRSFLDHFPDAYAEGQEGAGKAVYGRALEWFSSGGSVALDDHASDAAHLERLREVTGLEEIVRDHAGSADDGERAALMELVLEGLHQGSLLSRDDENETRIYGDMLAQMARSLGGA